LFLLLIMTQTFPLTISGEVYHRIVSFETANRIITRIEPMMTIIMAVMVGLFAVAIYLPMFDIVKVIGR
jgi:type II secretory pathway component PulF